ncbi:hypothetical protein VNO77_43702 [Canavalia gladiata]|uniref:Uncharacterized protein n=1 Tax=Canavalia gladiata TaxID=3824 RepID=A0AAN9JUK8_CANGL
MECKLQWLNNHVQRMTTSGDQRHCNITQTGRLGCSSISTLTRRRLRSAWIELVVNESSDNVVCVCSDSQFLPELAFTLFVVSEFPLFEFRRQNKGAFSPIMMSIDSVSFALLLSM